MNNWICEERFFFLLFFAHDHVRSFASFWSPNHEWFMIWFCAQVTLSASQQIPLAHFCLHAAGGIFRISRSSKTFQVGPLEKGYSSSRDAPFCPGFEPDKLMAAKTLRDWEQGLNSLKIGEIGVLKIKIDIFIGQDSGPRSKRSLNTISYILRVPPQKSPPWKGE